MSTILVAIRCITYNQEPYIRDCLEGFVMQKTNFKFVAIVHDDASTDNTATIIKEYAEKYPDIIKPIFETENQWSKKDGSLGRIMNAAIEATGAKYVAMCEGDDYWTDPYKLQKQVDFMEANLEYSLCFHKVKTLMVNTGEFKEEFLIEDMSGKSTILDLANGNYIHTPSVLYRRNKSVQEKYARMMPCLPGDYVLWMLLAETGDIYKLEDPMAVYRYGSGIWSNSNSWKQTFEVLLTLNKLSVLCSNPKVISTLKKQCLEIKGMHSEYVDYLEKQYNMVLKSKAYKIGKMIINCIKFRRQKKC